VATTLTRNLKLRVNSNLTADAKYNLDRIDLLGSTFLVDTTNGLNIRSQTDILIEPESADLDGSGVGGTVSIGTAAHLLTNLDLWGQSVTVPVALGLKDQASSGTRYLRIKYKSDLNGTLDTASDRALTVDMEGADRSLLLGGSLGVLGGDLTLNLTGTSSVTVPQTGTLSTLAGVETLTNKSMDGLANTFTNIQYASLNLTSSIVNADVSPSAAIAYSKLALAGSIVNSDISGSAAITYNKLSLTDTITNSDISGTAAIAYSKLNLAGALVNSDVSPTAAIQYSKLSLGGSIINTDISPTAAIAYSKLALSASIQASDLVPGAIQGLLPSQTGQTGKYLRTDGSTASWDTVSVSAVTSVGLAAPAIFTVSGSPVTSTGTLTFDVANQSANQVWAGPTSGGAAAPGFRTLVASDIPSLSYLPLAGGTLTGALTLAADPTLALEAATKQYVDANAGGGLQFSADWLVSDGATKVVTHNLNSTDVMVTVIDDASDIILVDVEVTDADNITLTSSEVPAGTWRVVIKGQ
jgi:hypothetical protein